MKRPPLPGVMVFALLAWLILHGIGRLKGWW